MPEQPSQGRYVTVARLLRARGNRGELAAELTCDDPAIFERRPAVELTDGGARRERRRIERTWFHQGRLICKFEGVDTISQAQRLAGWQVQIDAAERPPAPPGRYYLSDLAGCRLEEKGSGRTVGRVSAVIEGPAGVLLEVEAAGGQVLIPFAAAICVEIDVESRTIRVELPPGLEELNAGRT